MNVYFYMQSLSQEYSLDKVMSDQIHFQLSTRDIIERTDTDIKMQLFASSPYEFADEMARDSILSEFGDAGKDSLSIRALDKVKIELTSEYSTISKIIKNVQTQFGAESVNIIILSNSSYYNNFSMPGSNIAVMNEKATLWDYLQFFENIVFGEQDIVSYTNNYPIGHPNSGQSYSTLPSKDAKIMVYPNTNDYIDQYGYELTVGDNKNDVLNSENPWAIEKYLSATSFDNMEYASFRDTLTVRANSPSERIQVYPGFNDICTGNIIYEKGDLSHLNSEYFPGYAKRHMDINAMTKEDGFVDMTSYAVELDGLDDFYSVNSIMIRYIENFELPNVIFPDSIRKDETFEIKYSGTPELMTSWNPEYNIGKRNTPLIEDKDYIRKYLVLEEGYVFMLVDYNSLQVIEIAVDKRKVQESITEYIPPVLDVYTFDEEKMVLDWEDNLTDVTYSLYRFIQYWDSQEKDISLIASGLKNKYYTDTLDMISVYRLTYFLVAKDTNDTYYISKGLYLMFDSVEEEIAANTEIELYPNPAKEYINLEMELKDFKTVEISLHNLDGETLFRDSKQSKEFNMQVPTHELAPGVYIIHIEIDGKSTIRKFIKQ